MTEIPMWWLVVSGLFFLLNIVVFAILIVIALKVNMQIQLLQPKVNSLLDTVNSVATKVDGIATDVKSTVALVGDRAKGVANTAESTVNHTGQQLERFTPILMGVGAVYRIYKFVNLIRGGGKKRK